MSGKKRVHNISRGRISDTKYYNYIVTCLNYLISIEKNICVAMQSDNVAYNVK